jgi:hypothetical protein
MSAPQKSLILAISNSKIRSFQFSKSRLEKTIFQFPKFEIRESILVSRRQFSRPNLFPILDLNSNFGCRQPSKIDPLSTTKQATSHGEPRQSIREHGKGIERRTSLSKRTPKQSESGRNRVIRESRRSGMCGETGRFRPFPNVR